MFCRTGAARIDEVGFGEDDQIVGGDVDGVQPHRRLEHVLVVDADDQRRRPELARAASAIDPPISPRPTMPILSKIGGWPAAASAGLDDGKFHDIAM